MILKINSIFNLVYKTDKLKLEYENLIKLIKKRVKHYERKNI